MKSIYLDNAASTSVDPAVIEAMLPYYTEFFGNPSSIHALGRKTRAAIEKARKSIAQHLNASTAEIFFTSGGTESNNMVIKNSIRDLGVTRIITSKIEHHCVLHTCDYIKELGLAVDYVHTDEQGFFDLDHLEQLLQQSAAQTLVSLIHAHNEIGTINPIKAIGKLCKSYGAYFHADTVQTVAHYPIDLQEIPIDFISASAHKFHGPKGVGFVYINGDRALTPMLHGGSQERNMRAGTENLAAIIGMEKALDIAYEQLAATSSSIQSMKLYMMEKLQEEFSGIHLNGDTSKDSLYTVLNVAFPSKIDTDMLMFNLDIKGICVSAGSACSSGANKYSHVIEQIKPHQDMPSVRFSFSKHTTYEELDETVKILKSILQ